MSSWKFIHLGFIYPSNYAWYIEEGKAFQLELIYIIVRNHVAQYIVVGLHIHVNPIDATSMIKQLLRSIGSAMSVTFLKHERVIIPSEARMVYWIMLIVDNYPSYYVWFHTRILLSENLYSHGCLVGVVNMSSSNSPISHLVCSCLGNILMRKHMSHFNLRGRWLSNCIWRNLKNRIINYKWEN